MIDVILAGICLKGKTVSFESAMEECRLLCEACDYHVCDVITQNSMSLDPSFAFGSGKVHELKRLCEETDAQLVVFYNALSVQMAHRLSQQIGVNVIDRTSLILDIFALRARSRQAKLQVEMARLEYALPRIIRENGSEERSRGGGVTNRGAGEMRSSVIARTYKNRIAELKKELVQIENRRNRDERRRSKTLMKRVALVGYTNAGKSSLLNCIMERSIHAGNPVEAKDMLFATLDTSVRSITYNSYGFLLYDTVGFVSDLPEQLKKAFHSTLASALQADLLIHVIDSSDPQEFAHIQATEDTLMQIGAGDIPVIRVYNKIDRCQDPHSHKGLCISCLEGIGIENLLDEIIARLYPLEETCAVLLPYDKIGMFDEYQKVCRIIVDEQNEDGMKLTVSGPCEFVRVFDKYAYRKEEHYVNKNSLGKTERKADGRTDVL